MLYVFISTKLGEFLLASVMVENLHKGSALMILLTAIWEHTSSFSVAFSITTIFCQDAFVEVRVPLVWSSDTIISSPSLKWSFCGSRLTELTYLLFSYRVLCVSVCEVLNCLLFFCPFHYNVRG